MTRLGSFFFSPSSPPFTFALMENLRANLIGSGGLSQFEADVSGCLFTLPSLDDFTFLVPPYPRR